MEEEYIEQEEEEIQERSVLSRVIQGAIALLVLIGFVYISGVYQYFLYA